MAENKSLLVAARVKDINKAAGFNTGADYLESFDEVVLALNLRAQERANANGRKTLKAQDA